MILSLIDKNTLETISDMEVDFIPEIGEEFFYGDESDEEVVRMEKVLKPTLFRGGLKYYKVWISR